MKRNLWIIIFGFSVIFLAGACSEDDEPDVQRYSIKVTNITNENAELFIAAGDGEFKSRGIIPSGEFREFNDMQLNVNYKLRASAEGSSSTDYFNEQAFQNSNPDVQSLNFDIF